VERASQALFDAFPLDEYSDEMLCNLAEKTQSGKRALYIKGKNVNGLDALSLLRLGLEDDAPCLEALALHACND
jgi:hypothetical protein